MDKMFKVSKKSRYSLRKRTKGLVPVLLGVATLSLGIGVTSGSVSADEVSSDTAISTVTSSQDSGGDVTTVAEETPTVAEETKQAEETPTVSEETKQAEETPTVTEDSKEVVEESKQSETPAVGETKQSETTAVEETKQNGVSSNDADSNETFKVSVSSDTRTEVDTSKQTPVSGSVEVPFELGSDTKTVKAPRDIVIILDTTTSMVDGGHDGKTPQQLAYDSAKAIIDSLGDNDRAIITYASINKDIRGAKTHLTGNKADLLSALDAYMIEPTTGKPGIPSLNPEDANPIDGDLATEDVLVKEGIRKENAYVLWLTDDWLEVDGVDESFFNWVSANTKKQLAVVNTYSLEHGNQALSTKQFRDIGGNVEINATPDSVLSKFNEISTVVTKDEATLSVSSKDNFSYSNIKIVDSSGKTIKTIENKDGNFSDELKDLDSGSYKLSFDYKGAFKEGHRDITATVHAKIADKDFTKVTPVDQENVNKEINIGRVVVTYKSGSKELAPSVTKFDNSDEGTDYDVSDLVKSELTVDGKKYILTNSPATKGKIQKGTTEVAFEYKLGTAPFVATFRSADGVSLKDDITKDLNIDSTYDISSEVPSKLTKDGKSYTLVDNGVKPSGTVTANGTHLDFVYNEDLGKLTVVAKASDGTVLNSYVVGDTHLGSNFDETSKVKPSIDTADGKHYVLDNTSLANAKGQVDSLDKVVNIVYNESKGTVTVTYLDENGGEFQSKEDILTGSSYGVSYDAKDKYLDKIVLPDGRTFTKSDKGTTLSGKVDKESTVIPLSYTENKGTVTVTYLDESGKEFQPKENILTGSSYGVQYDAKDKYLDKIVLPDGRTYTKSDKGTVLSGKLDKDSVVIPLTYTENKGTVTVHYLDESGREFQPSQLLVPSSSYGVSYDAKGKYLDKIVLENGRVYKKADTSSDMLTGKVDKESTDINLNYKEVKTSLTLKFVANNVEIQKMISLDDRSVGEDYDLTSQVPSRITVKGVGTFKLVSSDLALKGKLTEEPISLEAQYVPIMTKTKIMFVDETGKEIVPFIDVDNIQLDSSYDFTNYAQKTITLADGRQFELTAIPENITGTGLEDGVVIKLVYREIVKPVAKTESVTPVTPVKEEAQPVQVSTPVYQESKVLPNTGEKGNSDAYLAMGIALLTVGLGTLTSAKRRKGSDKE